MAPGRNATDAATIAWAHSPGAAVALLAGNDALATQAGAQDVQILNTALGAVPLFGHRDLAKAAASILGDEAMHWAILRQALGEAPVPAAFMS